ACAVTGAVSAEAAGAAGGAGAGSGRTAAASGCCGDFGSFCLNHIGTSTAKDGTEPGYAPIPGLGRRNRPRTIEQGRKVGNGEAREWRGRATAGPKFRPHA